MTVTMELMIIMQMDIRLIISVLSSQVSGIDHEKKTLKCTKLAG